ncbi:hypothetical protein H5410_041426 [Solanum commersonii]|uniref:Uncharacterized protein n=1 Tax=Solanum commersonii TaxID=4109 RepID=A0A9J5XUQ8_SOLCO|nr:hypothetical protein H5410_041426 [Solanum commersonii]
MLSIKLQILQFVDSSTPQLELLLLLKQTQVQRFKKGISNSATQDSILNVHNKTQFTYVKIKCALKDSSFDLRILNNLMLTIVASNASSSSTNVFKFPHTRNDSIFTHKGLIIQSSGITCNAHTYKEEHNA